MPFWRQSHKPINDPPPSTPVQDIDALGTVVRQNHIAYVPSPDWSTVPGVGVANLAYVPDFLLSAPEYVGGNAIIVPANGFMLAQKPGMIVAPKTVLEGVGGITAGQLAFQQLLEVNANLGNTGSE